MGTTYYLVDAARKEVLDVGKWYALDAEYGRPVTLAQLAAADPHPAVLPWAEGRSLVVISDAACMEPWIDHDDPYLRWRDGWRVWELVGADGLRECFGPVVRVPLSGPPLSGPPPDMLDSANHPGVPHRDEFGGTHCPVCGCVDGNGLSPCCPGCGWTASGTEVVLYGYGIVEEGA